MTSSPADIRPEDGETSVALGELLRRLREAAGLTTRDMDSQTLTEPVRLTRSKISKVERGELPSREWLRAYVSACGIATGSRRYREWEAVRSRLAEREAPGKGTEQVRPPRGPVVPFQAPALPAGFVPRNTEGRALLSSLLGNGQAAVALTPTGVRGTGGFGKTTLAVWACHQPEVRAAFPDGVLWVDAGQEQNEQRLIMQVRDLVSLLTGGTPPMFATSASAGSALAQALGDRQVLLVIDDAWRRRDLEPFLREGPRCVRLITTRMATALPPSATTIVVDRMSATEAMTLLRAGVADGDNAAMMPVFERSGRWPLAITLLNGVLRSMVREHGLTVPDAVAQIVTELDQRGTELLADLTDIESHTADASIGLSLDELGRNPRSGSRAVERFVSLGSFPQGARVAYGSLIRLWDCSELEARQQCSQFANHSLAESATAGGITLHDVIWEFLARTRPTEIQAAHRRLLTAYRWRDSSRDGWQDLAADGGNLFDELTYHLAGAGLADELEEVTTDLRFLCERVRRSGPAALVTDARLREPDDYGRQLTDLVRDEAHLLVGHARLTDLAVTLHSRIVARPAVADRIRHVEEMIGGLITAAMPFPDTPDPRLRQVLTGHAGPVNGISWRPDGGRLASGGDDSQLCIHQPDTGDQTVELASTGEAVRHLAWSPNLLVLAVAAVDGSVTLVDPQDGSIVAQRSGFGESPCLAWSPDGTQLAVGGADEVVVWQVEGDSVRRLMGSGAPAGCQSGPRTAAWGRRGLAVGCVDGSVIWWDPDRDRVRVVRTGLPSVKSVAWHPDRAVLAVCGSAARVALVDVQADTAMTLADGTAWQNAVAWSRTGELIAGDNDGQLTVWPAAVVRSDSPVPFADVEVKERFHGRDVQIRTIAPHPRQPLVAVGSHASVIRLWDLGHGPAAARLRQRVNTVRWSPSGRTVAIGTAEGALSLLDSRADRSLATAATLLSHGRELRSLAWSPDGRVLLSLGDDGNVRSWDVRVPGSTGVTVAQAEDWAGAMTWHPDGRLVAVGGTQVVIYDAMTWKPNAELDVAGQVNALAFDRTGDRLAVATSDSDLFVSNLAEGTAAARWSAHRNSISSVAWSPHGDALVTSGYDGKVVLWEASGEVRVQREADGSAVWDAQFSPDGAHIVAVTMDGSILLWDAAGRRQCRLAVDGHLASCSFAPGGDRIVLGGAAGWYLCRVVARPASTAAR